MDMENQLVFEEDLFFMEKDSDVCQKISGEFSPCLSIWNQQLNENFVETVDLVSIIYQDLDTLTGIKDTPMDQLVNLAEIRFSISSQVRGGLVRKIKKAKLAEKRTKAKERTLNRAKLIKQTSLPQSYGSISSNDEIKKQKNRLSAQISRDRKKEHFKQLQAYNNQLLRDKQSLEDQNRNLRQQLQQSERTQSSNTSSISGNRRLLTLLVMLGIIFLVQLLGINPTIKKKTKTSMHIEKVMLNQQQKQFVNQQLKDFGIQLPQKYLDTQQPTSSKTAWIPNKLGSELDAIKKQFLY